MTQIKLPNKYIHEYSIISSKRKIRRAYHKNLSPKLVTKHFKLLTPFVNEKTMTSSRIFEMHLDRISKF